MVIVLLYFVILHCIGVIEAQKKRDADKHSLPIGIKQVLFLGTFNKYSLSVIIVQVTLVLMTIVTLVIGFFGNHLVYAFYMIFGSAILLMQGIFSIVRYSIDYSRHKEKYKEHRRLSRAIVRGKKRYSEAELAIMEQRCAQLRDYLYNKKIERV